MWINVDALVAICKGICMIHMPIGRPYQNFNLLRKLYPNATYHTTDHVCTNGTSHKQAMVNLQHSSITLV